jgi:hypothetical protein
MQNSQDKDWGTDTDKDETSLDGLYSVADDGVTLTTYV